jgi:hypothetical protein
MPDHSATGTLPEHLRETCTMYDADYGRRMDEIDRLLNDPDVPMDAHRVWLLMADIAERLPVSPYAVAEAAGD